MAQEEHLSFKGVPINGTLKQYKDAMVKKGFVYEGSEEGLALLSGDFAGYKNCIVGVSTLKNCDVVSNISVLFPKRETWSSLIRDYENLKSLLIEKYGEPAKTTERFTTRIPSDDDYFKMSALHSGEIEWYTLFSTDLGDIELSIETGRYTNEAMVRLSYYDAVNSETVKQSALDDL